MCIVPQQAETAQPAYSDGPAQLPRSWETAEPAGSDCPAHLLTPQERRQLALDVLAGQPISRLAQQHLVSRKFVYQQLHIALDAVDQAFAPEPPAHAGERVLFYLPVTKAWIRQFVLALVLICHC